MRVKRNTKKIIRRKGSKKNMKRHLKKYVGGADGDGMFDEYGKLSDASKENIGVVLALIMAGVSAVTVNAVINDKFPNTHEIIGNIIYSFLKLIPVGASEIAMNALYSTITICSKLSYIIKGAFSIIWMNRAFVFGTVTPTAILRAIDLLNSVTDDNDFNHVKVGITNKLNTFIDKANYNYFYDTTFKLLVWLIEMAYASNSNQFKQPITDNAVVSVDHQPSISVQSIIDNTVVSVDHQQSTSEQPITEVCAPKNIQDKTIELLNTIIPNDIDNNQTNNSQDTVDSDITMYSEGSNPTEINLHQDNEIINAIMIVVSPEDANDTDSKNSNTSIQSIETIKTNFENTLGLIKTGLQYDDNRDDNSNDNSNGNASKKPRTIGGKKKKSTQKRRKSSKSRKHNKRH